MLAFIGNLQKYRGRKSGTPKRLRKKMGEPFVRPGGHVLGGRTGSRMFLQEIINAFSQGMRKKGVSQDRCRRDMRKARRTVQWKGFEDKRGSPKKRPWWSQTIRDWRRKGD